MPGGMPREVEVEDVALIKGLYFLQVTPGGSFRCGSLCLLGSVLLAGHSYSRRSPVGRMPTSTTLCCTWHGSATLTR